jgi:hypothetical protein
MEIYANIREKVDINPNDVIEKLKDGFFGDHGRWIGKEHGKWCILANAYHNRYSVVREITDQEKEYFDALEVVEKYLNEKYGKNI